MSVPRSGESSTRQNRLAARVVTGTLIVVICLFVAARLSSTLSTGHYFDYLHWTIAYAVAATLAWMGVRHARNGDVSSRRWFAWGLTVTLAAQLLFDWQEITQRTPITNLSDALFLSIGPCFVMGMLEPIRGRTSTQRRSFDLNVTPVALVVLTLTSDLYLPRSGRFFSFDHIDHLSDLHAYSRLHWLGDGCDAALDGELSMAAASRGFCSKQLAMDDLE